MLFEAELFPLFIGGVCVVSLLELGLGLVLLKGRAEGRPLLVGHTISMAIAMVFLIRCIFTAPLGIDVNSAYGDAAPFYSLHIALFGSCWAISVFFLLALIGSLKQKP